MRLTCKKCNIEKEITDFNKDKECKYGVAKTCKVCRNQTKNEWIKNNPDKRTKSINDYNKTKGVIKNKIYYANNKELVKTRSTQYVINNEIKVKEYRKQYRKNNREHINKLTRNYYMKYPWRAIWRRTLNGVLKRLQTEKTNKTIDILGYTFDDLKIHLESKFDQNMTWDNYGTYWVVDHIKPISKFKSNTPIKEIHSLNNLQPLEKFTNLKKAAKYEQESI